MSKVNPGAGLGRSRCIPGKRDQDFPVRWFVPSLVFGGIEATPRGVWIQFAHGVNLLFLRVRTWLLLARGYSRRMLDGIVGGGLFLQGAMGYLEECDSCLDDAIGLMIDFSGE